MPMRTLLVPLSGADGGEMLLDVAFDIARRFDAHVDALHVRPDPAEALRATSIALPGHMRDSVLEVGQRHVAEAAERAHTLFHDYCARHEIPILTAPPVPAGISAAWHERVGKAEIVIALRGRLADLIVVSRPIHETPAPVALEAALMETGRPVLVLPPSPPKPLGTNIVIGWNGSKVAAAAVAAARPFLEIAKTVTILTTREGAEPSVTADDLKAHLAWNGIAAEARSFEAKSSHVGRVLLEEARKLGANLLVLGGYGHSVTREIILGGVTRHVLSASEIPILMLH